MEAADGRAERVDEHGKEGPRHDINEANIEVAAGADAYQIRRRDRVHGVESPQQTRKTGESLTGEKEPRTLAALDQKGGADYGIFEVNSSALNNFPIDGRNYNTRLGR